MNTAKGKGKLTFDAPGWSWDDAMWEMSVKKEKHNEARISATG